MGDSGSKVVVAMSGGVDSSVAAALLQQRGYDCVGVFMRLGTPKGVELAETCDTTGKRHKQGCCSVLDADDARRVADLLKIPFYVCNFQDDFGRVIDYFVNEYNRGRTPNPCVRCNDWLKFGKLAQYARAVGADFVASGHYARIGVDAESGQRTLLRGLDHTKDQSYVLFGITPEALAHTLLPIGDFNKSDVRQMAADLGLPTSSKPDSQEICFVPDQDYAALVRRHSPDRMRPGVFVDSDGNVVGEHDGHQQFTIGQRKGLRLALGYPVYVVDIDADGNRVMVADRSRLLCDGLRATEANFLLERARGARELPCQVKIRYNHTPQPALLTATPDRSFRVRFAEPQTAVTPGQAAVCYDGDAVLCGGWIDSAE